MRLLWAADTHFDHAKKVAVSRFFDAVEATHPDALLITGDIAQGDTLPSHLNKMADAFRMPILFVLGNHDFYNSSIDCVRREVAALVKERPSLVYLPALSEPYKLSADWALVGADGWGDGRVGNFTHSRVLLSDWEVIKEFWSANGMVDVGARTRLLHELSDADALLLARSLAAALEAFPNVLSVSHVPPFEGAAWYEGKPSDRNWAPWFTWKAGGDALLEAAERCPEKQILALCSHTHDSGTHYCRKNLEVRTSSAIYGYPEKSIQGVLEF